MRYNIIVPTTAPSSFYYVALRLKSRISSLHGHKAYITTDYNPIAWNIVIHDICLNSWDKKRGNVYWYDSPFLMLDRKSRMWIPNDGDIYMFSRSTVEFYEELLGISISGWIPAPIDEKLFSYHNDGKFKYDLVIIGFRGSRYHKNLYLMKQLALKLKVRTAIITDDFVPRVKYIDHFKAGNLSEEEKAKILASSKFLLWLSRAEGFGMPVLEAMAVGTPVIYSDAPAHNEFAVGIPVPTSEPKWTRAYLKKAYWRDIDIRTAFKVVSEALEIDENYWKELSNKARKKAEFVYAEFLRRYKWLLR